MNAILPGVAGLSRDTRLLAALTIIATRADDLLALAERAQIPGAIVRADARRIRDVADSARRLLVEAHSMPEAVQ